MTKPYTPLSMRSPEVEAQALNETEQAMRDLVQVGINIGASKPQLAFMMHRIANELMPKDVHAEPAALQ